MNNQQIKGHSVAGVGLPLNAVRTGDQGWTPVSDRLPLEEEREVLVRMRDGRCEIAWAVYWHGASNSFASWSFRDPDEDESPTHWMPLPPAPSLGDVSVPGETAAGAQKQDHPSEIAELEQEASLMRARNERLQQERDALLEAASQLLVFVDNLLEGAAIAKAEGTQSKFERSTALYLGKLSRLAHDAIDKTEGRA